MIAAGVAARDGGRSMGLALARRWSRRLPVVAPLLILVAALALRMADPPGVARLRDFAFDTFQRLQPRSYDPQWNVRIVDIDEASLAAYGQWPWPRDRIARLVDKLTEQGAAVIAFDVLFAEPDASSWRRRVRELIAYVDPETVQRIANAVQDNDQLLADAFAHSTVVTAYAFDVAVRESRPPALRHGYAISGEDPQRFIGRYASVVTTLPLLEAGAKGNGGITPDYDITVIRRVPLLLRLQDQPHVYPALAMEAVRTALGASTYIVRGATSGGDLPWLARVIAPFEEGVQSVRVGDKVVPTDRNANLLLYDSGHQPQRFISAKDVLEDRVPRDKVEGSIIFIGTSAAGLKDIRNTPVDTAIPGVEIHAQAVEQIFTDVYLWRPFFAGFLEGGFLLAVGLLFVFLMPRLSAGWEAVLAVAGVAAGLAMPWVLFAGERMLVDPIYPPATLALMYAASSASSFMLTERERAQIRGAFGLYLSPDVVEELARSPERLQLGGEERALTVMFTDVRGFTTIAEQFDPQGLTRFMNRFLTPMTNIILAERGTIDKYMGDAIMAFWNAPLDVSDHAARACRAALAMQARLKALNVDWREQAHAEGRNHIPVTIGIGLNTGRASVGNFGSDQRFTYSVLGDDVNLAARLEGQCKAYGVAVIVGEDTQVQAPGFAYVELDLIKVKGKTEPERIFALVGDAGLHGSAGFAALLAAHAAFLAEYRAGRFAEARRLASAAKAQAELVGWSGTYYDRMRKRLKAIIADPPAVWDGVYEAKEK
ncbi:adenylate/guanylate cyclase domain-containing protein [Vineibacter terrae]|uniref:CHASE2 domain-containing protein n=1 Tax=Vineibacter terrae TaxID=2586908 RepID=UPI002E348081|nr:adenylate/guanylate cyclase domain-containing protein [Vineibacter terrae]HEX2890743.1 adenylate/guanylate cyclase domain-containing protein [Vineibacter terrae]